MADPMTGGEGPAEPGPVIRDRRRLDPRTGQVRETYGATGAQKAKGKHVSNGAPDVGARGRGSAPGKGNGGSDPAAAPPTAAPEGLPEEAPEAGEGTDGAQSAEGTAPETAAAAPDAGPAEAAEAAEAAETAETAEAPEAPEPGAEVGGPDPAAAAVAAAEAAAAAAASSATGTAGTAAPEAISPELAAARAEAEERLGDLQRLQAEFVNYRRRVERDRTVARDLAVAGVLEALLPVLDDVHLARQHGDLEGGPFAAIADKLETVLGRQGLQRYGEPGEEFDPSIHEALMHTEAELAEGTTTTTVVQVLQPGYRAGDRVLRPARVAVADPPA
jgi:molecular chaperone GrpE